MSVRPRIPSSRFKVSLGITHFIRIPLLNQYSSSQIQETLWQVANDPLAATVPPKTYQPLQSLSLSIASLSLPTEESKNRATFLLQDLVNQDWQDLFSKAQETRSTTRISSTANPGTLSNDDRFGPRPLIVDLVGLGESVFRHSPSNLQSIMGLYTFIKEPLGILESFCAGVLQNFLDAGLARRDPLQGHREGFGEFLQVKAISTKGLRSGIPNTKPSLRHLRRRDIVPKFDASKALFPSGLLSRSRDMLQVQIAHLGNEPPILHHRYVLVLYFSPPCGNADSEVLGGLCEKFKDVVWGKGVHLDRVCISKLGPEDIFEDEQCVGKRYHDIASVPLPGVTSEPRSFEKLEIPYRWATAETQGRDCA